MWWSEGALDKNNFAQAVRYMINQGLIHGTKTEQNYVKIPSWVKADASWWASGEIDINTFAQTLQYLISSGIVKV